MRQSVARKFSLKKEWIIYISITVVIVLLNVLAWNSTAFCDTYITYIFPLWVNTYGRLTGMFSFSVGEWLLVAGVLLLVAAAALGVVWLSVGLYSLWKPYERLWHRVQCIVRLYFHVFAWILAAVGLIMTLNCSILYHASTFSENYFGKDTREYTVEDVMRLYSHMAQHCNELSQLVERDENGSIVYHGYNLAGEPMDMEEKAVEVMQQLGKAYPRLDGYYPRPKPMMFSDFMCQQYMCGYYFPFSMEANYNDVMYLMNKPATMCHELAHLRGYIYEDEANFIGYLACVQSDDITFQYAGYLSVINYLLNDLYKVYQGSPEVYKAALEAVQPVELFSVVQEDNVFVTEQEWERINEKALIDTETVDEISDTFTDTTLKLNGVSDGMVSYSRVVRLLLQYYYN